MLSGSFFYINNLQESDAVITADIIFNAAHPIFKGHFPAIPVVPGVCMIQLVKEVLEQIIGNKIRLTKAAIIKFLTVITPTETPRVKLKLQYKNSNGLYDVQAELYNPEHSYFKFKGELRLA